MLKVKADVERTEELGKRSVTEATRG